MKKIPDKTQNLYVTYLKQYKKASKGIPFYLKGVRMNNMEFCYFLTLIKTVKYNSKNRRIGIYFFSPPKWLRCYLDFCPDGGEKNMEVYL